MASTRQFDSHMYDVLLASIIQGMQTQRKLSQQQVQKHLQKVYAAMTGSMLVAAAGAYFQILTNINVGGWTTLIATIGVIIRLNSIPDTQENKPARLGLLAIFSFLGGLSLGPLLSFVMKVDPSVIPTAFIGTMVIFISFSAAAHLNKDRTYIQWGGFLISCLFILCFLTIVDIFVGSMLLFSINVYVGFAVFCGLVLYDTQMICEKAENGDTDYIKHSLDLFLDFMGIFRRLLLILSGNWDDALKKKDD